MRHRLVDQADAVANPDNCHEPSRYFWEGNKPGHLWIAGQVGNQSDRVSNHRDHGKEHILHLGDVDLTESGNLLTRKDVREDGLLPRGFSDYGAERFDVTYLLA